MPLASFNIHYIVEKVKIHLQISSWRSILNAASPTPVWRTAWPCVSDWVWIRRNKQIVGWNGLVQGTFRYLAFVKTAMNFRFFIKHPLQDASEPDLGLRDNLVNYCSDIIDVKPAHTNLQEIWSKFFQKFRRRNWRKARPSNKAFIFWTWCKDGLRA